MAFGYRRPAGSWKVLDDVNILLGKSDEPYDPTHLFDLWGLSEGERAKAAAILADIFFAAPDEIRKLDEEDITFQQYLDRMSYDMPSAVSNFLGFFANMAIYDPNLAPTRKQLLSAGTICPSDPDSKAVGMLIEKAEEVLFELWPEIVPALESKRYAGPAEVARLTRDRVIHGQGGECMGLGQTVGQCGSHKSDAKTPIEGLILVGIDAGGGEGMGVHQSVHSAIKVAHEVDAESALVFFT